VPAYLADLFGTKMVGAIHGRLLTAWSVAGVLGPVLVSYIRDYQIAHGIARSSAYNITMYILAGLLALGLLCNALVRPVPASLHMREDGDATSDAATAKGIRAQAANAGSANTPAPSRAWLVVLAWSAVWIPIGWGIWMTLTKAIVLLR
jgi:hypothetical protein